jgi:hypothetical protein
MGNEIFLIFLMVNINMDNNKDKILLIIKNVVYGEKKVDLKTELFNLFETLTDYDELRKVVESIKGISRKVDYSPKGKKTAENYAKTVKETKKYFKQYIIEKQIEIMKRFEILLSENKEETEGIDENVLIFLLKFVKEGEVLSNECEKMMMESRKEKKDGKRKSLKKRKSRKSRKKLS